MQPKNRLFTTVIATHFARLMLLFEGAWVYQRIIVYYDWHLDVLYFLLFLIDLIPFLMFWFLRPAWELSIRLIGLMWVLTLMAILLPWRVSPSLLIVFCIQIPVLIWPKQYITDIITPEQEVTDDDDVTLFQLKCAYCRAIYSYNPNSISNGEVTCQNCGKSNRL